MITQLALIFVLAAAQAGAEISPTFEQYPVTVTGVQKPAQPNLKSHPEATKYRSALRKAAGGGPNFAGAYTLVRIGCGSGCSYLALIDARDGKVFFPKALSTVHEAGWWKHPAGPVFNLSSRLLVVYGQANSEEAEYGISYFEWTGSDFKLVEFQAKDRGTPPK